MLRSLTRLGAAIALAGLLLPQDAVSAPVPKREIAPLPASKTALVPFEVTPFPYRGEVPDKNRPFLDVADGERHGHSTVRGGTYWEDQTYSDQRVLLHIPKGFDPRRPALMVVFFHGNEATLERDVRNRQAVPRQVTESGLNAVLVEDGAHECRLNDRDANIKGTHLVIERFRIALERVLDGRVVC